MASCSIGNAMRQAVFRSVRMSISKAVLLGGLMLVPARVWCAGDAQSADAHIQNVVTITEVYPDGQKVSAVAVQYDRPIQGKLLKPSSFVVKTAQESQKITGLYSTTDGANFTRNGKDGDYVVLKLSTDYTVPVRKAAPRRPQGQQGTRPAPPSMDVKRNAEVITRVGDISWDPSAHPDIMIAKAHGGSGMDATVTQVGTVITIDGQRILPGTASVQSEYVRNRIVDGFLKPDMSAMQGGRGKFSIHFPHNYDVSKKYPLIIFLVDSNEGASTHASVLTANLGGVVWANPAVKGGDEAIVIAPVSSGPLVDEIYQPTPNRMGPPAGVAGPGEAASAGQPSRGEGDGLGASASSGKSNYPYTNILALLDALQTELPVDKTRIYITGEGDGARTAIKMMLDRPDLFAGGLLFSPDYDPVEMARLAKARLWIVNAQGDAGSTSKMEQCIAGLQQAGARVAQATWNGDDSAPVLEQKARQMVADPANIKYAEFRKGTLVPRFMEEDAINNRVYTWRIGYTLAPLREWLLKQRRQ
jgi:predicted peptidase